MFNSLILISYFYLLFFLRLIMTARVLRDKIYSVDHYTNSITRSKLPSNIQVLRTLFFNLRIVKLNVRDSAKHD